MLQMNMLCLEEKTQALLNLWDYFQFIKLKQNKTKQNNSGPVQVISLYVININKLNSTKYFQVN